MTEPKYFKLAADQIALVRHVKGAPRNVLNLPCRIDLESEIDEKTVVEAMSLAMKRLPYCRLRLHEIGDDEFLQYYLSGKSDEFNEKVADLDLDYTPDAKKGSQEEKVNKIIDYIDTYNTKLLLATQKYSGVEANYDLVLNAALSSARFAEAAKQIEKLKKTEKGAERTTKQFNKALLEIIKSTDYKGSNLEELIEYLKNDLGFEINTNTEKDLMSLSEAIVATTIETKDATKTNLLFADSYSKITAARKAFEEGLQNVETGTEDFESYANSYETRACENQKSKNQSIFGKNSSNRKGLSNPERRTKYALN